MSDTYWTRERIIAALQAWAQEHGRTPAKIGDWRHATPDHPAAITVDVRFGSWNNAILEAGLPPNRPGIRPPSQDEIATAMLDWFFLHGRWPRQLDWQNHYPCTTAVTRLFGSWSAAKRYAGWPAKCGHCDKRLSRGRRRWCSALCRQRASKSGTRSPAIQAARVSNEIPGVTHISTERRVAA